MSRNEPGLYRAISLRPSLFHANTERAADHSSSTPQTTHDNEPHRTLSKQPTKQTTSGNDLELGRVVSRPTFTTRTSNEVERQDDLESQSPPAYSDPYKLRDAFKAIDDVTANVGRKRRRGAGGVGASCADVLAHPRESRKARKLRGFYETQNERIEKLLMPVDEHVRTAREEQQSDALQYKIAVSGSFAANICLAVLQVYGATSSGSLSLFTTMADAIFDPLSNLTLILSNRAVNSVDSRSFPSGKARIETAGNITFCFLMTAVSLILIVESIRQLATGNDGEGTSGFHLPSVIAVATAFVVKLVLFIYCWALRNKYSQIRILWEDHRNDLFINGFGLLTSVGGSKLRWWIDPMGAILLSVLIAFLWTRTAYSEFQLLIGITAKPDFLQLVTYVSMTHSPSIVQLDTVRAWYSGPRLIVEVDVVMDQAMTLKETHDVAEELQFKLESLPDVERCYVHVDYETSHAPEHFLKKEL